jgi:hypothetical protein
MRQRACIAALVALLATGPGCFVIDELDNGMELMEGNSPSSKKQEPEPAPVPTRTAQRRKGPEARKALTDWWKGARTPASGPEDGAPTIEIVSCRIGGEIRFMSKTDCEVQGGSF